MTNTFAKARLKLAVLYTLIFGSVIIVFSGVVYKIFADDIQEDMISIHSEKEINVEIISRHKTPLRNVILLLDGSLVVFIAFVSYYLADITLKPIQINNEAEKRFIANASHELRTPIAILKTDMEVSLMDKEFPKNLRPVFGGYLEEINNMKLIVENMLTMFRFESHQMKLNKEVFSLSKMLTQNVKRMRSYALSKEVTIKLSVPAKVFINSDKFFIQQAFRNILKNAIEYSRKQGEVIVILKNTGEKVVIEVSDHGVGIPKEILTKIFDRYQRSAVSSRKRKEGVGLGLTIAKQIIDLHKGEIKVSSVENEGTSVLITLPGTKA
jgi:signal transduction histidine kinase